MKKISLTIIFCISFFIISCSDDNNDDVITPVETTLTDAGVNVYQTITLGD
jgi:hypothetical protein